MPEQAYLLAQQEIARLKRVVEIVEGRVTTLEQPRRNTRIGYPIYRKTWWRIVTNEGAGEYTCRKKEWDTSTKALIDITDEDDPDYNIDVTGYDARGRDSYTVGADVEGWYIYTGGDYVLLLEERQAQSFYIGGILSWDNEDGSLCTVSTHDVDGSLLNISGVQNARCYDKDTAGTNYGSVYWPTDEQVLIARDYGDDIWIVIMPIWSSNRAAFGFYRDRTKSWVHIIASSNVDFPD